MRQRLLLLLLLAATFPGIAQKKNQVALNVGTYRFYDVIHGPIRLPVQLGLSYERRLTDKFSVLAAYTRAPFDLNGRRTMMSKYKILTMETIEWHTASVGKVTSRYNYNYIDIGVIYSAYRYIRHNLRISASASLANGLNTYVTKIRPPAFVGDYGSVDKKMIRESTLGGTLGMQYQFEILLDKLSVSALARGRFYAGNFPFQMNYGLQAAFHF